jgi:hypothetical protein
MNKGLWFSSPKKIAVTLLNAFAICVGIVLVSYHNHGFINLSITYQFLVWSRSLHFWKVHSCQPRQFEFLVCQRRIDCST